MLKTIYLSCTILIAALFGNAYYTHTPATIETVPPVTVQDQEQDDIELAARKAFMQGKLESNKKIVHGITTRNYEMTQTGAAEVTALVKGQHWFVLDTPEYKSYSDDMRRAAKKLENAATDKNLDAATLQYFDLTVSCVDCHRYIETVKY